jgi:PEP-CTERM motif
MTKSLKAFVMSALAVAAMAAQAGTIVDSFSTDQSSISDAKTTLAELTGTGSSVSGSGILGGSRDLFVVVDTLVSPVNHTTPVISNNSKVTALVENGAYSFSSENDTYARGYIVWDGSSTLASANDTAYTATEADFLAAIDTDGLNADLSTSNVFVITAASDLSFDFSITIYDMDGSSQSLTFTSSGAGTFYIPFAWFGSSIDFENIGAVVVALNVGTGTASVDLTIDNIEAVPEPASLALVGLGLVAAGVARRRQTKASV